MILVLRKRKRNEKGGGGKLNKPSSYPLTVAVAMARGLPSGLGEGSFLHFRKKTDVRRFPEYWLQARIFIFVRRKKLVVVPNNCPRSLGGRRRRRKRKGHKNFPMPPSPSFFLSFVALEKRCSLRNSKRIWLFTLKENNPIRAPHS